MYNREGKGYYKYDSTGKYNYSIKDFKDYVNTKKKWKWNILDKKSPYYTPFNKCDKTLVFESRFESGNLGIAMKISDSEYKLTMQNDCLTNGCNQCLFILIFRVLF